MSQNNFDTDKIDLLELLLVFWKGKYVIILISIIALTMGSIHLRGLSQKFEVSTLLAPVQEKQNTPNFSNLNGLASLAGINLPSGNASDFGKFEIMLKTHEIAKLIFNDKDLIREIFSSEWDDEKQTFREPKKNRSRVFKEYLKTILTGRMPQEYNKPNAADLVEFLNGNIDISIDKDTRYLRLSAETGDPKLLAKLMNNLIDNTDELFKKKFIKQANDALKFYQIKISKSRSQEHREILATLIAEEERKLLLATREGPFVAEILTGPNISLNPTSPKASRILALSLLIGVFLSCGVLLFRNFLSKNS